MYFESVFCNFKHSFSYFSAPFDIVRTYLLQCQMYHFRIRSPSNKSTYNLGRTFNTFCHVLTKYRVFFKDSNVDALMERRKIMGSKELCFAPAYRPTHHRLQPLKSTKAPSFTTAPNCALRTGATSLTIATWISPS